MKNLENAILKVEGMSCGHCEKRVAQALMKLKGVRSASASAKDGEVKISYNSDKVSLEKMKEAILDSGYTPM
jgi:copper chaperone CopZ